MDRPHWPQEKVVKPMEEIIPNSTNSAASSSNNNNNNNNNLSAKPSSSSSSFERSRVRPQKVAAAVNCPRCDSTNTKFCYYNNYSLSQPRYFCKTCRRYWTEGGTLRNIPVGGGSRKNKRSSSSSSAAASSLSAYSSVSKKLPDLVISSASASILSQLNPRMSTIHHDHYYGQDLNLGFPSTQHFKNFSDHQYIQVPNLSASHTSTTISTTATHSSADHHQLSALELLTGITTTRGGNTTMNSFMPIPIQADHHPNSSAYSVSMIPMPEFKIPSSLGFSLDEMENNGGNIINGGNKYENGIHESSSSGRLLFPFEELKTNTSTTDDHHDDPNAHQQIKDGQNGDSNGFWNGMMGGGSW